jgi:hypothetical protein
MRNGVENRTEWIGGFVQLIRQRIQALEYIPFRDFFIRAFNPPAQIIAVTTEYPSQSRLYLAHIHSLPDLTVWAYGPVALYELLPLFEEIAADQSFEESDAERPFFWQEPLAK